MTKISLLAAAISICVWSSAQSAPPGMVGVLGAGMPPATCSTWTAARRNHSGALLEQWAFGYISGFAISSEKNALSCFNAGAVLGWVDDYCARNPGIQLIVALTAFSDR